MRTVWSAETTKLAAARNAITWLTQRRSMSMAARLRRIASTIRRQRGPHAQGSTGRRAAPMGARPRLHDVSERTVSRSAAADVYHDDDADAALARRHRLAAGVADLHDFAEGDHLVAMVARMVGTRRVGVVLLLGMLMVRLRRRHFHPD